MDDLPIAPDHQRGAILLGYQFCWTWALIMSGFYRLIKRKYSHNATMVPPQPVGWTCPLSGWKVKIRGNERLEEPHVTIIGPDGAAYRLGLCSWAFMDDQPPPRRVPSAIVEAIRGSALAWKALWNRMYPKCPIEMTP